MHIFAHLPNNNDYWLAAAIHGPGRTWAERIVKVLFLVESPLWAYSSIQRFEFACIQPIFACSRSVFMPAQLMRVHSSGVPPPFQCVSRLTASE
jgi:hypothetical protein